MSRFGKRFSWFLFGLFVFGSVTATFALTVTYKPFGVPDSRRGEYEAKVAKLRLKNKLLQDSHSTSYPNAVVDKATHDFGMLDPHTTASHEFKITNNGTDPLALDIGDTGCKCTTGKLQNGLLQPGESTTVKLTWNTGYQADEYRQTATLITNDPLKETITLAVEGEIRAKFIAPERIGFNQSDPGVETDSRFVVFSQLWNDFDIEDVRCDRESFDWHAERIDNNHELLADKFPRSAWRLTLLTTAFSYGDYEGKLTVVAKPKDGGEAIEHEIAYSGRVRSPVSFYHPNIHKTDGLDIGTLSNSKEHNIHLVARVRGDVSRHVEVLDIEPKELKASLKPLQTEGTYRLTITVPKGCRTLRFNAEQKHGYVQVGDPKNKQFSNWFPLKGFVSTVN